VLLPYECFNPWQGFLLIRQELLNKTRRFRFTWANSLYSLAEVVAPPWKAGVVALKTCATKYTTHLGTLRWLFFFCQKFGVYGSADRPELWLQEKSCSV